MKLIRLALIALVVTAAAFPQTAHMGLGAYSNESGAILMAVDSALVKRTIDSPYVMFVVFMAAKDRDQAISVAAKDVVMVYKGQEYPMSSVKDLRDKYRGGIRDIDFYRHLGKEGINSSWIRLYDFPEKANFFPPLTLGATLAVTEGHMVGIYGFMTPMYFKNPGFAKGDKLTIKVRDTKDPQLAGECEVVLD
jgi:hypothetical protein